MDPGVMKKGGLDPRSPLKMPGLPKGPFSQNPAKRPDSIRDKYGARSPRGARCAVFMIWVSFPLAKGVGLMGGVGKKGPPKRNTGH